MRDSQIEKNFMKPKRCCGLCLVVNFLNVFTIGIVVFDITLLFFKIYAMYEITTGQRVDNFNP